MVKVFGVTATLDATAIGQTVGGVRFEYGNYVGPVEVKRRL